MTRVHAGPLLEATNLSVRFTNKRGTVTALDGVNLELAPGAHTAICGTSGSGKSTFLSVIAGLCRPDSGGIILFGIAVPGLSRESAADFRAKNIGLMFQSPGLLPNLRLVDNVALPALLAGESPAVAYERAVILLEDTGLGDRLDSFPAELSGGQQRRAALARALSNRPGLLLADEPTNDLDPQAAGAVISLMLELAGKFGATILLVTHDPSVAKRMARVVTLSGGRIIADKAMENRAPELEHTAAPPPADRFGHSPITHAGEIELAPVEGWLGWLLAAVGWLFLGAGLLFALDQGVGYWQGQALVQKESRRKMAEALAMESLRADIAEVVPAGDGRARVSLFMENYGRETMSVLGPVMALHYQRDRKWEPLALQPDTDFENRLHPVTATKTRFSFSFPVPAAPYDELVGGYTHLRITATYVVGGPAGPAGDLFERTDDYYIYLKDPNKTDAQIRQLNNWGPNSTVPPWMAMPSH
ncbi:MAG: ABC transporter ATP-binding protein [Gemmataceae bacterium]